MVKERGYEFDLSGKTAMITGAAGGIGLAIAEAFTRYGADAALCDIRQEAVQEAAVRLARMFGVETRAYVLDVTKTADIEDVVVRIPPISAGLTSWSTVSESIFPK